MRVYIIEDDPFYAKMLEYLVTQNPDNSAFLYLNAKDFLSQKRELPDVITIDYSLPDMSGMELLKQIKKIYPTTPVVVISAQKEVETVLDLLKQGAYDYVIKNDDTKDRLWTILKNLKETQNLKQEIEDLREEVGKNYDFSNSMIGESEKMEKVFKVMGKATKTSINVTISGETGTGKEVVAKSIHYNSSRSKKKFVAVNMAAIPENLIESELFGYEKGAFTGANDKRKGKFEEANGGTIFLDEIGELDISMQAKLLRVLQEGEVTPLGGNQPIKLDVRILSATHRDLKEFVKDGLFREDLYYRLIGLPIALPPLRDRGNDVMLIANYFLNDFTKRNRMGKLHFSTEAKKKLMSYHFPGNIRELKSITELCAVMAEEEQIQEHDISLNGINSMDNIVFKEKTLREFSADIIRHFLEKYDNNVIHVAKILDVSKSKIYQMIKDGELV